MILLRSTRWAFLGWATSVCFAVGAAGKPAHTIVEKQDFTAECQTQVRRDTVVESSQSFTLEVTIEKHVVRPSTPSPTPMATTVDELVRQISKDRPARDLSGVRRPWPKSWGTWRVRHYSGTNRNSFGSVALSLCSQPCAFHLLQGLDIGESYFVIARPSHVQINFLGTATTEGHEVESQYPGTPFAKWLWKSFGGYGEQFSYTHEQSGLEVGKCNWSPSKPILQN